MRTVKPLINREQEKHLSQRDRVPTLVLNVLSRAEGLDLLEYPNDREQVVVPFEADGRVPAGSEFVGFEFDNDVKDKVLFKYLVTTDVPYPEPGYPEAYDLYFGDIPYICDLPA